LPSLNRTLTFSPPAPPIPQIDHIKVDGCKGFDSVHQNASYAIVGRFLQAAVAKRGTGKPVIYHPSNLAFEFPRQFRELAAIANQWRFFNDVQDSWASVAGIIAEIGAGQPECKPGALPPNCTGRLRSNTKPTSEWCASFCVERDAFLRVAGRGGWHDPDMLLAGETPCSAAATAAGMKCDVLPLAEQQTQLAIWALASAPLQLSADLTAIPPESLALLTNRGVLAINQDALGRMPFRYSSNATSGVDVWRKDLAGGDVALAIVNMGSAAAPPAPPAASWLPNAPGIVYADDACPNVGSEDCSSAPDAVACCRDRCGANAVCDAFNANAQAGRCVLRNCSAANLTKAVTPDAGWVSQRLASPRPAWPLPLAAGFRVTMTDAGFNFNTNVAVKDVFGGADLGVHTGTFTTSSPIPPHGTLLLRLTYSPQYAYPARGGEL
jgi:hypothetical protein